MQVQIMVTDAHDMKVTDARIGKRTEQHPGAYPSREQQVDALRSALQGAMDTFGITFAELFTVEPKVEEKTATVHPIRPHGSTGSFKSAIVQPHEFECGRYSLESVGGDFVVVFGPRVHESGVALVLPISNPFIFRTIWMRYSLDVPAVRRMLEVDKFQHSLPGDTQNAITMIQAATEASLAYWNDGDVGPGSDAGKNICYKAAMQILQEEK